MIVLAADTSTTYNSVAVCRNQHLMAESTVDAGRKHSERLLATVDWVLNESGLTLHQIDLLAISIGPGSFTGLRVGVAAWKGLALAGNLPLMGVPTLDAMARLAPREDGLVCPLLDAKMGEVFGAVYRNEGFRPVKTRADAVCPVDSILDELDGPVLFLGDGASLYRDRILKRLPDARFVSTGNDMPRAWTVAHEALELHGRGACVDAALVVPIYLRRSQAEELRSPSVAIQAGEVSV